MGVSDRAPLESFDAALQPRCVLADAERHPGLRRPHVALGREPVDGRIQAELVPVVDVGESGDVAREVQLQGVDEVPLADEVALHLPGCARRLVGAGDETRGGGLVLLVRIGHHARITHACIIPNRCTLVKQNPILAKGNSPKKPPGGGRPV